jgi:CheY-like chemotaxis protein
MAYIMVVDDDPRILGLVAEILMRNGHTVVTAPDAFRALEALNHREPNLILTDICMPDLDGHALCRAVRRYHPDLPIVALTAEKIVPSPEGFYGVIGKPFQIAELTGTIKQFLNKPSRATGQTNKEEPA